MEYEVEKMRVIRVRMEEVERGSERERERIWRRSERQNEWRQVKNVRG